MTLVYLPSVFSSVSVPIPTLAETKLITFLECHIAMFSAQECSVAMETRQEPDITLSIFIFSQTQMEGGTRKNKEIRPSCKTDAVSPHFMHLVTCKDVFGVNLQVHFVLLCYAFHDPVGAVILLCGQQPTERLREHPKKKDGGYPLKRRSLQHKEKKEK